MGDTGTIGQGYEGETKYDPMNAPVVKNGGNDPEQAGKSYGSSGKGFGDGSIEKAKEV